MRYSEQKIFPFTKFRCRGLLAYIIKGPNTFLIISLSLVLVYMDFSFLSQADIYAIIFFVFFSIAMLSHFIFHYNIVHEIKVDKDCLYVLKLEEFKKIPWHDIEYIKAVTYYTRWFTTFKIVKKKGVRKLPCRIFIIVTLIYEIKKMELINSMLSEIEKRTKLICKM